ncbi:MAG: transglutaminase domain-containing protein, partial [Euryarchaeota archaeon]|nr:transglutaminase domain-containing protein [Euryarchaeota archaeon]
GPHDWAMVYTDGKWLPVDGSFGNLHRHSRVENEFYFGNLDAFRMVANDDLLSEFNPKKRYWRSDPVDNQVGEVENEKENIYYDGFSWKIYVKDFKKI